MSATPQWFLGDDPNYRSDDENQGENEFLDAASLTAGLDSQAMMAQSGWLPERSFDPDGILRLFGITEDPVEATARIERQKLRTKQAYAALRRGIEKPNHLQFSGKQLKATPREMRYSRAAIELKKHQLEGAGLLVDMEKKHGGAM